MPGPEKEFQMVGLVIVSHGPLADSLKAAAEMIVGPQTDIRAIGMGAAADVDRLRADIESAVEQVGGAQASLVLVDVMGGSPANASAYLAVAGTPVVCGVNLPMLLEVLMARTELDAAALAERALSAGKDSVLDLRRQLTATGTGTGTGAN
jgi:mannose PTS system EIIA component